MIPVPKLFITFNLCLTAWLWYWLVVFLPYITLPLFYPPPSVQVNGIDLRMASHEEALSVLRLSPQHVRLCVYRHTSTHTFPSQATHTHEDMWDLFTVDLQLQPGQELGLSIVGKRYIQHAFLYLADSLLDCVLFNPSCIYGQSTVAIPFSLLL